MTFYAATQGEIARQDARAMERPATIEDAQAPWYGGLGEAITGAPRELLTRAGLAVEEAAAPTLERTPLADFFSDQQRMTRKAALDAMPKPWRMGWIAQAVRGTLVQVPEILVGAAAGAAAGAPAGPAGMAAGAMAGGAALETWIESTMRRIDLEAQGVDHGTAASIGLVQGAYAGTTALLPSVIGQLPRGLARAIPYQVGTQAGLAVALGQSQRVQTALMLDAAGYPDLAAQIHPYALSEIVSDALMGGVFGIVGAKYHRGQEPVHIPASDTADAALAGHAAGHAGLDTMPGAPKDVRSFNAHVEAMTKAEADLLADRPVDVSRQVEGSEFLANPEVRRAREAQDAEARTALREVVVAHDGERDARLRLSEGRSEPVAIEPAPPSEKAIASQEAARALASRPAGEPPPPIGPESLGVQPPAAPKVEGEAKPEAKATTQPPPARAEGEPPAAFVERAQPVDVFNDQGGARDAAKVREEAEAQVKAAEREASAFEAAINCALRTGT